MNPRSITRWYQTAARAWLTLAAISLLVPPRHRLGVWLPLHLALAGAIATAISGAMQNFMQSLTATRAPPAWTTWAQLGLVTVGAALVAIGMIVPARWLVAVGGTSFVLAMAILAWMLWRAWHRSLNKRHVLPLAAYAVALAAVLLGGTLGALMGSGAVTGELYGHFRRAHMTLNVLGFASLTVVGTLVTLLPTTLRVRIPPWPGRTVLGLFGGGLALQLVGWDLGSTPVLTVGGALYAAGALGIIGFVVSVLRIERRWRPPLAALHMLAAAAWFVWGSLGLAWALAHDGFDLYRNTFLVAFVGGWLVQVLLGAWSYLLPMQRPARPDVRRRMLAAFEVAAPLQLVVLNGGLVLLALRGAGSVGPGAGDVAVLLTATGVALGLTKAWLFAWIGRGPVDSERSRAVWGG